MRGSSSFDFYSEVHDRPVHLRRLEGHGQPPTPDELVGLPWPQREWWNDRDRIVLLHEFVQAWPPMGHHNWEFWVMSRAMCLWNAFRNSGTCARLWEDIPAPGYRMLTSFPCCPRYLRPLMSPALLERSHLTDEGRAADKWPWFMPKHLVHERQDAERAREVPDSEWAKPAPCGVYHPLDELPLTRMIAGSYRMIAGSYHRDEIEDRHRVNIEDMRGWTMSTT